MGVRIFISSPGDMGNERAIARRSIEQLRGTYSGRLSIEAYFWEDEPVRASAGFQEQIPDPGGFDIVICMFWSKLGTPLPALRRDDGTSYESGTVYECEVSIARSRRQQ